METAAYGDNGRYRRNSTDPWMVYIYSYYE